MILLVIHEYNHANIFNVFFWTLRVLSLIHVYLLCMFVCKCVRVSVGVYAFVVASLALTFVFQIIISVYIYIVTCTLYTHSLTHPVYLMCWHHTCLCVHVGTYVSVLVIMYFCIAIYVWVCVWMDDGLFIYVYIAAFYNSFEASQCIECMSFMCICVECMSV